EKSGRVGQLSIPPNWMPSEDGSKVSRTVVGFTCGAASNTSMASTSLASPIFAIGTIWLARLGPLVPSTDASTNSETAPTKDRKARPVEAWFTPTQGDQPSPG